MVEKKISKKSSVKPKDDAQSSTDVIVAKLFDKLRLSGWSDVLKTFLLSEEFNRIISLLEEKVLDGKRFTPPLKQVFAAFENCPVDKLKVVLVTDEPYCRFGIADGMAFSCSNTGKAENQLQHLINSVESLSDGGKDTKEKLRNGNLICWAEQGVLLLNASLTTQIDKPGKHASIWQPFTVFLIDMLRARRPDLVWILMGSAQVHDLGELIPGNVIFSESPPPYLDQPWNSSAFADCNQLLLDLGKAPVEW